jgi:hypothetical protein
LTVMTGSGSYNESIASTSTETEYLLFEAGVRLVTLRGERELRTTECRLFQGVFVPKMRVRGVNSG